MELIGQIEDIIYRNEVNSYCIAVLSENEIMHTVVGYLPFIDVGDSLKVQGNFVIHQEYGEQFKIDTFEKIMPQTLGSLEKYLASGNIKGIGPATAKKIITQFGEETISVFKFEPSRLSEIKGISKDKAQEMGQEFNEKWELWQIVGFLEKFGIGAQNSKKVFDALGADAIEKIEENPYILIDITYGVDFNKIDKIALELGIPETSESRIKSGIKYALLISSYNGHTCVLKENLIQFVIDKLRVNRELVEDALISLNLKEEINIEKRYETEEWVYLEPFYKAEKNIVTRLLLLKKSKNLKYIKNFEKELKIQEDKQDINLSEEQTEALKIINDNNVTILTGGPGTGKTTILKSMLEIYKRHGKKVVLCAPTGRAAKKMSEATDEDAKTIHRLLEIGKIEDDKLSNIDIDITPIDADVIIIDEVSMVDIFLMNYITKGMYLGTKLILVGDSNQLPSVGPGSILKDLIDSECFATIKLTKIFRQAAKSKIIVNAHNVNNGKPFLNKAEDTEERMEDFFYINEKNTDKIINQVISLSQERLRNYGDYDFFSNIQVLTPTKKGALGTKELNKVLQNALNPKRDDVKEKQYGDIVFRIGDRVMQVKNNYDIYWEKEIENGSGIFNGEIGRISNINEHEKQIEIKFDDGKKAWYAYTELEQIEHAYAITIHKAQGSEFDVVIMVVPHSSPMLLTRNLLYTGITRAKKLLIVIGENKLVNFMIENSDSKARNTGIAYKLLEI